MLQTIHKLYTNPTLRRSQTLHWGVQNPTQRVFAKLYTKRNTNPIFCFWTRISRMEFRTRKVRMEWMVRMVRMGFRTRMERMVRIVRNVCNERYVRYERKTGNGNKRWRASSLRLFLSLTPWLFLSLSLWLLDSSSLCLFDSLSLCLSFPPPRHSCAPLQKSNNFEPFFSD